MFITRLLSGIALIAIMLAFIIPGGLWLAAFVAVISLIGLFELYRAFKLEKTPLAVVGYATTILYYFLLMLNLPTDTWLMGILLLGLLALMCVYVFTYPKYEAEQVLPAFTAIVYAPVLLSHIYLLRQGTDGKFLVWLIFLSAWGCDTCAYAVGRLLGKHKMAPVLSPKKSVEGAIGGVVGAALLGLIYGSVFSANLTEFELISPAVSCAMICGIGGAISMIGDLAASAIKRNKGIKDYGTLIPGHGGIMDRFDSILFTAPIIYYLVQLLQLAG